MTNFCLRTNGTEKFLVGKAVLPFIVLVCNYGNLESLQTVTNISSFSFSLETILGDISELGKQRQKSINWHV